MNANCNLCRVAYEPEHLRYGQCAECRQRQRQERLYTDINCLLTKLEKHKLSSLELVVINSHISLARKCIESSRPATSVSS